ncbi:hypothetical protein DFH28DRAFT_356368 [Melampsora americana]|nr:hypothetical protein DFH28DRAFT_356368 [Melampsora americana]
MKHFLFIFLFHFWFCCSALHQIHSFLHDPRLICVPFSCSDSLRSYIVCCTVSFMSLKSEIRYHWVLRSSHNFQNTLDLGIPYLNDDRAGVSALFQAHKLVLHSCQFPLNLYRYESSTQSCGYSFVLIFRQR